MNVRAAQKREGFDDRVAHRKALRAMEQYGRVLAATRPDSPLRTASERFAKF